MKLMWNEEAFVLRLMSNWNEVQFILKEDKGVWNKISII